MHTTPTAQVSLLAIRERELNLYSNNFRNIGTRAALIAGFAYSGCLVTGDLVGVDAERAVYIFITTGAMSLNVCALFASVTCCMFGPGLALRGPDGSMDQAVEGLALEYRTALIIFFSGLVLFYLSATIFVLLEDFTWGEAIILCLMLLYFARANLTACKRIYKKFRLTAEMAVAGSFAADGTTGGVVPVKSADVLELERLSANKRLLQWPRRQYLWMRVFWDEFLGISVALQQQRYENTRLGDETQEKRYNYKIHNILRHLELPSHITHHTPRVDPVLSSVHASSSDYYGSSSTLDRDRVYPISKSKTPHKKSWRTSEEKLSLPASTCNELELSAMAPHEHLKCGALSPPNSEGSQ
ncbi:hypothetical protein AB1Y20_019158 [Prymnesium parvum]|uniref:Uncharacterized protein n=1 Tax=Prymnesium parvum TaxID=97485 RepID=A0AB34JQE0_PRYPA